MNHHLFALRASELRLATPVGQLSATVIHPRAGRDLPPLVVLHGISQDAPEQAALFLPVAPHLIRVILNLCGEEEAFEP